MQNFVAFSEYLIFTSILWIYIQKILGSEYGKNTYIPCLWMRHNRYLLGKKVVKQMFTDDLVELISSLFDPMHPNNWIPVGVRQSLCATKGQSDSFWYFLTGSGFFKKTHKCPKWPKMYRRDFFYFEMNNSRWDLCHLFHCIDPYWHF